MATRARIGIKQKSGRIIASYHHWDGYPGGLGYNLCENWENSKKVSDAIKLGDSSKWGVITGESHDFDKDRLSPVITPHSLESQERVTTLTRTDTVRTMNI